MKKGSQRYDDNSSGTEASEASSNGYADIMQAEPFSNEEEEEEHVDESEGEVYSDTEDRESISTQKEGEEPDEENLNVPKEVKDFVGSSINDALSQFKLDLKQTMDDAVTSMAAPIQRLIDYSSTSAKTEMVKGICRKEIETALPDIYSHVVKMQKTDESKKHVSGTPSESKTVQS
ncbi:hypothetical protein Bbelb_110760 [Branchiostoma belcheri]|nr:hypothetical protein Bbelb_110760 [Branchiostoma belcheri]